MHSKNLQITLAWILLASLFMGMAVWQAQVSVERGIRRKHEAFPQPTNTRHAVRSVLTASDIDPVADYIARCEKGMTVQEIRWALTDFENAGLVVDEADDEITEIQISIYRKAQRLWYLQCLSEALHLSREQAAQVSDMLRDLFLKEKEVRVAWLQQKKESDSSPESRPQLSNDEIVENALHSGNPFQNKEELPMQPWELCKLTSAQERLTWEQWFDLTNFKKISYDDIETILNTPEMVDPQKFAKKTGGLLYHNADPVGITSGSSGFNSIPSWVATANYFFPLLAIQKLDLKTDFSTPFPFATHSTRPRFEFNESDQKEFLDQIRRLHPVQLKMSLLQGSYLFEKIREALENHPN